MKFVLALPQANKIASRSAIIDVAQAADDLGFWAVSLQDHIVFNGGWIGCGAIDAESNGDDRTMYESLTTLSFVAGFTKRVRLWTGILLLPVRETVLMAKQVATLDNLSAGRVVLGIGSGLAVAEDERTEGLNTNVFAKNAVKETRTFHIPRQRGRLVDEQIQAMKEIWTTEVSSFSGEFVQFDGIEVFPKPAQPGGPPIVVGGNSAAALRRTTRLGDGWLPFNTTPEHAAQGIAELKRLANESGVGMPVYVGPNLWMRMDVTDAAAKEIAQKTAGNLFEEDLLTHNLVGSPETIVSQVQAHANAGVNFFELKPIYRSIPELIHMMEIMAKEVFPACQSETPVKGEFPPRKALS
jgi:alkanesulfonate monooxygenase SsuD/methylene tetrahydromethanopterin reductase-like flavin-dependent oxidoreductase (luciferase family)